MSDVDIEALARAVSGDVARPGDEGYEEGRSVWNVRFDRRPAVIVCCREAREVFRISQGFLADRLHAV